MSTILILDDAARPREALAETLRRLFPRARVIAAGVDARFPVLGDGRPIVLVGVTDLARVRGWAPPGARIVALTREMGPATLVKAESHGVAATLRAPAGVGRLQAVLEPMLTTA
jgi:hypothetical protein